MTILSFLCFVRSVY